MVEPPEKGERAILNPNLSTRQSPVAVGGALTPGRPVSKKSSLLVGGLFSICGTVQSAAKIAISGRNWRATISGCGVASKHQPGSNLAL